VESIAASHTTTVTDISNVNAMGSPIVAPGDILAIPLSGKQSLIGLHKIGINCRGNCREFYKP
jgi:hypothetical protein